MGAKPSQLITFNLLQVLVPFASNELHHCMLVLLDATCVAQYPHWPASPAATACSSTGQGAHIQPREATHPPPFPRKGGAARKALLLV